MNTLKLHIEHLDNPEFIHEKQVRYSYAFRSLFKQLEMTADRQFMFDFNKHFNFNEMEFRSLKTMCAGQYSAQAEIKKQTADEIEDLKDDLSEETDSRKRFKLQRKIRKKEKSLGNNPVFGKRSLLGQITRECNKEIRNEERLNELRTEYRQNRIMPFVIEGEANQYGNRFFDLKTLNEGYCIYKPERGQKYRIDFKADKKQKKEIRLIVEQILQEAIPVTVQLSAEYLYLSYDNEKLHGYELDERGRKQEVSEIKSTGFDKDTQKTLIKECYRKYSKEQEERRLKGKNPNRYVAIDMNPTNIGCSILEKINDEGEYKVLKVWSYDFSWYFPKRHLASNDPKQKRLNNKRKYELTIALKRLFMIAERYGCAHFVLEDLDFKSNDNLSHEANRKNKNMWCRGLCEQIITRRCKNTGIELIKINACYTSFIGNIQHGYGDSCSASIEIGRRGMFKYTKGMFYPMVKEEDIDTLGLVYGRDVLCSTTMNWVEIYKSLKESFNDDQKDFQDRFRAGNVKASSRTFSMSSYKSHVKITEYIL